MGVLTSPVGAALDAATGVASAGVAGSRALLTTSWTWARGAAARTARLVDTTEVVLDELLSTLREARPLLQRLDAAVEAGVFDDLSRAVIRLDEMRAVLEQLARDVETTLPRLESLAATQADVEGARAATERLVSLVDATLTQLDSLPGASIVRRRMSRVSASASYPQGPEGPEEGPGAPEREG